MCTTFFWGFIMGVPANVRAVERPSNTIVQDSGSNSIFRYCVRMRNGYKYGPKGNPQPINGSVVGHIVDFKYVPLIAKSSESLEAIVGAKIGLSYGASALVYSIAKEEIIPLILATYPINIAGTMIGTILTLASKPGTSLNRVSTIYRQSALSVFVPGVAISSNSISSMYEYIGKDLDKQNQIIDHFKSKISEFTPCALDGTLVDNESIINTFSNHSYKGEQNGYSEQKSVLMLFNLKEKEPVCSNVYPGNLSDKCVFKNFIEVNNIKQGLIVADKSFEPSIFREIRCNNPELHYLVPIKRNSKRIIDNNLGNFIGEFDYNDRQILYSKTSYKDGDKDVYLYHYLDTTRAHIETLSFLENSRKKGKFDAELYQKSKDKFGTITLESDLDLDTIQAYELSCGRWPIEVFFRGRKNDLLFNITNVQNNFSVRGQNLIELFVAIIYSRIIKIMEETGLNKKISFKNMMDDLRFVIRLFPENYSQEIPFSNDPYWVVTTKKAFELLETLSLSKPQEEKESSDIEPASTETPKRKPGRPKGSKNKSTLEREDAAKTAAENGDQPVMDRTQHIREKRIHPLRGVKIYKKLSRKQKWLKSRVRCL